MTCPACLVELRITKRQGVEIDYCPHCRGMWLDRGELDSILERSNASHYFFDEEVDDVKPTSKGNEPRATQSEASRAGDRRALPRSDFFHFD
jgi:Zn-finger nucleic acid-binding protein